MGKETKAPASAPADSEAKQRGKTLWAAMLAAVDGQIAGDRNHGWVGADSLATVEAIVAEDASLSKCGDVAKFTLSGEALAMISAVINPSAFRQQLEDPKGLNKLDKSDAKRSGSLKSLAAEFGS